MGRILEEEHVLITSAHGFTQLHECQAKNGLAAEPEVRAAERLEARQEHIECCEHVRHGLLGENGAGQQSLRGDGLVKLLAPAAERVEERAKNLPMKRRRMRESGVPAAGKGSCPVWRRGSATVCRS